jgi:thiol-disulfide isomerase/thioredoxin
MHSSQSNRPSLLILTVLLSTFILLIQNTDNSFVFAEEKKEKENQVEKEQTPNPFPKRFKAPDLTGGVEWLNTSGEINLRDLKGKIVLLDFWTFCCINCIHVLPDLAYLEKKFDKEIVVIGVHSAKFDNEKETKNIREAIKRYEITHPVVNDANMTIWRKMNVRSWPTLVLIDPEGYYCGYVSGEGKRELLENVIGKLISYHRAKGTLDESPVHFDLEKYKDKPTPLKYPGKILADKKRKRLFISDSNHNRIVISDWNGQLLDVIGSGKIGSNDGSFAESSFDHPQGMELVDDILYVADTENHLIRSIDLKNKKVTTLAGTGKQARFRANGGPLKTTALNSPWAMVHHDGILYIAMAGPHQIWKHKIGSGELSVFAGSGREDILDGTLEKSAFAQPSGIATDGKSLFIADSEGSAIRKISLASGEVSTVVGESNIPRGQSLFSFGDVDGKGKAVRLQHPLGVIYSNGKLYITDTYNHKIKEVTLSAKEGESSCKTFFGNGKNDKGNSPESLSEPAGLALAGNEIFIADTNHHRIIRVNRKDKTARDFVINGLKPPVLPKTTVKFTENIPATTVESITIKPAENIEMEIDLPIPEGYKLNSLFPVKGRITRSEPPELVKSTLVNSNLKPVIKKSKAFFKIPFAKPSGSGTIEFQIRYGYCRDGVGGVCKVKTMKWKIPLKFDKTSNQNKISIQ